MFTNWFPTLQPIYKYTAWNSVQSWLWTQKLCTNEQTELRFSYERMNWSICSFLQIQWHMNEPMTCWWINAFVCFFVHRKIPMKLQMNVRKKIVNKFRMNERPLFIANSDTCMDMYILYIISDNTSSYFSKIPNVIQYTSLLKCFDFVRAFQLFNTFEQNMNKIYQ